MKGVLMQVIATFTDEQTALQAWSSVKNSDLRHYNPRHFTTSCEQGTITISISEEIPTVGSSIELALKIAEVTKSKLEDLGGTNVEILG